MKRKLLFMAVGLILVLSQANAYTTENLVSDGWSLVTSLENNKDYVYVFVDAGTSGYAVSGITTTVDWRVDDGPIPTYQTLSSPFTTPLEVWTIETRNDGYALRNIVSQDYFNSNHGGTGEGWRDYMNSDYATGSFTFNLTDGKYSITGVSSGQFVGPWNDNGAVENDGEAVAANKTDAQAPDFYIYKMAKATYALKYMQNTPNLTAPVDVSFLIVNPTIYQGGAATELPWGWSNFGEHKTGDNKYTYETGNTILQGWVYGSGTINLDIDYYQRITNLPSGKYKVQAYGKGSPERVKSYLYICPEVGDKVSKELDNTDFQTFETDYLSVSDGSNITLGIEAQGSHWAGVSNHTAQAFGDDFCLKVDPYLSTIATEFTNGSTLTAGIWYYFELATTDAYDFLSSAATTLTYTCAETPSILVGDKSEETFAVDETKSLDLTAGRVYFKVSEATTLTILFRYTIGSPAADKSYIQPGNMVTVSYASLSTNDPSASADIDFSGVTLSGEALDVTPTSNGFTFTVPDIEAGQEYTLSIPAESIGYDEGSTYNAAQNITLNTIAIYDGVYYMYNTYTNSYLSRSGAYGTAAIVDNKGLAVHITTDASNNTKLKFFDNLLFVGYDGFCYGDVQDEDALKLNATAVPGGYKFLNTSNSAYFAVFNGHTVGDAVEGDNLQGTSNIWALESTSEHFANYTVNANVQAAEAASNIPSLSSITTKAALDAELTANYNETPIAITGSKNEKYQEYAGADYELVENEYYKETIENLTPGLYKLSVDAFQRAAWNEWVTNADGARGTIYLYANGAKTQLKSVFEYGANEAYTQGTNPNYESKGLNYPNSKEAGYAALETGNYKNEVYVYVPDNGEGKGTLVIGINNPTRQGYEVKNGTWAVYDNWTLTYYDQTPANMTITDAKYATFVAPFDVEIPSGVTAYTVDDVASNGSTLEMTEVISGTIEKNTPVVLYSESTYNETFYGKTVDGAPTEGLLTGVYERTAVPDGSYVLQNNGGKVGFYLVDTSKATPYVNANRAYLTIDSGAVKAFFFGEDTATAIQGVFDDAAAGEVYDVAGRKLGKLQKGVNIVNGKKVLVK